MGSFLTRLSAIKRRVFKQCATKGRGFHIQKCAREGMVSSKFECRKSYFALIWQKLGRYAPNDHLGTIFVGFCASKGMNFCQIIVPVREGVREICANEGRGSAAPS